jgi:glycosyltransferase involved in cell wall biosynthesis
MTVLHIATTLDGGAGIGLRRYHETMLAAGLDARVIVGSSSIGTDSRVAVSTRTPASLLWRLARRAGIQLDPAAKMRAAVKRLDAGAGRQASYELFSPPFSACAPEEHPWVQEADEVNLHWVAETVDWPRFLRKIRKPMIFTLHDQQPYLGGLHYAMDLENNPWLKEVEARARAIKLSALNGRPVTVIGNSEWNMREAEASGFFPAGSRFHTVYYPLDTNVYAPRPKDAARAALGIESGRAVIGFACDDLNNRRKGFDILLVALQSLPAAVASRTCLLSFGREPAQQVRDRVPSPWFHLGCLQADAVKVATYSAMDVFVIPSRAEAFGQTAIEALACGTAVVGSNVGGISEALDHGRCGLLCSPDQPESLATELAELLTNAELRVEIASRGRAHVQTRHSPEGCARTYLKACRELLACHTASSEDATVRKNT